MKSTVLAILAVLMTLTTGCARHVYVISVPARPQVLVPASVSAKDAAQIQKQADNQARRQALFQAMQPRRQAQLRLTCPNPEDRANVVINDVAVNQGALVNRIFANVRTTVPQFNGHIDIDSPDGPYVENMCPGGTITLVRRLNTLLDGNEIRWWWEAKAVVEDGIQIVRSREYRLTAYSGSAGETKQNGSWIVQLQGIDPIPQTVEIVK